MVPAELPEDLVAVEPGMLVALPRIDTITCSVAVQGRHRLAEGQVLVGRARTHRIAKIDLALVQQTPAEVPVRRQPGPVAGRAERLGHAGDDPDAPAECASASLADPVHARGLRQADLLQLELLFEPRPNRLRPEHPQPLPPVVPLE